MFGPQRHDNLAAALPIAPDARVLDLGCGAGETMAALARRLGPGAALVGVDLRPPDLVEPLASDPRVRTVVADLDGPLPLADASADAAVCFNTLECLRNKEGFLVEAARVVVPGGHLLLGHADFDTLVFNSPDLELTRRLVHAFCDTTEDWMATSDGTMGRKLLGWARRSPFEVVESYAWVGMHTDFSEGGPARVAAESVAAAARRDADLDGRVDGWLAGLEALASRGEFLYSINDYAVLLRRPAG